MAPIWKISNGFVMTLKPRQALLTNSLNRTGLAALTGSSVRLTMEDALWPQRLYWWNSPVFALWHLTLLVVSSIYLLSWMQTNKSMCVLNLWHHSYFVNCGRDMWHPVSQNAHQIIEKNRGAPSVCKLRWIYEEELVDLVCPIWKNPLCLNKLSFFLTFCRTLDCSSCLKTPLKEMWVNQWNDAVLFA